MKNLFPCTLIGLAILALTPGCASIVSKSSYPVTFSSNPSEAEITVTNCKGRLYATGVTPLTLTLKSGSDFFTREEYSVTFSKTGYETMTVPVTFSIDGWYFGNILLGGLIGMLIVDPATGAMWKVDMEYYNVTLRANGARNERASLSILDIDGLDDETRSHLVRIN